MTRRQAALTCAAGITGLAAGTDDGPAERVRITRVPEGGLQPQVAVDERNAVHLVYYLGDPRQGNLFYVKSIDSGKVFSQPIPINSQPGSAIATGTIRGAQLAVGKGGRVHVAWNGSMQAQPAGPLNPDSGKAGMPMLYTRMNDSGRVFEPQRNLMLHSFGLDGGGSIAADRSGNLYVAWHGIGESEANGTGKEGEARRRVWVTKSRDEGASFSTEEQTWPNETGACGCCGMKIFADRRGEVFALYRSATESVHRDIYLLQSADKGRTFQGRLLHKWDINACPMSSMDFAENGTSVIGAWETGGQVYWKHVGGHSALTPEPIPAPGEGKGRKHPRIAVNGKGEVILVWTEGTGWQRGGSLAYQIYHPNGQVAANKGQFAGIPIWSFASVIAGPDNHFTVFF